MNQSISGFHLPHAPVDDRLYRILDGAIKKGKSNYNGNSEDNLYWNADYFGLNQVAIFREANAQEQQKVLAIANRDLLAEVYWVEQAGVGYMAKMVLGAESHEERILYGLFAADEANHLAQIAKFCPEKLKFNNDSFLNFMGQLLESQDKALLITMVQVVLEGWSLIHYRSLSKHCLDDNLKAVLKGFLNAEARHHATGVNQLQQWQYSQQSLSNIHEALTKFLQMVQVGPQRLLNAVEQGKGYLSNGDRLKILTELQMEVHTQTKLNLLQSLMVGTVPKNIVAKLKNQGSFIPYTPSQCVR